MKKIVLVVCGFLFLSISGFSQDVELTENLLSGNISLDSRIIASSVEFSNNEAFTMNVDEKRKPMIAGLLSAVLPGAGQYYNEDYWKTAIFVALEAAAITTSIIYNGKGDDKTDEFENYADQHFSVVKYAEWILEHRTALGLGDEQTITIDPDVTKQPWERVNWDELHAAERNVRMGDISFSHTLEHYGEQQYYEMIGKYPQFSHGWDDKPDTSPVWNDPVSSNFSFYSTMRGDANDFYNMADRAILFLYVNHVLSAVEAIWSAIRFNNNIAVKMQVEPFFAADEVEMIPTLRVQYKF